MRWSGRLTARQNEPFSVTIDEQEPSSADLLEHLGGDHRLRMGMVPLRYYHAGLDKHKRWIVCDQDMHMLCFATTGPVAFETARLLNEFRTKN